MVGRGTGHIKWGFVFSFTWRRGGGGGWAGLLLGHGEQGTTCPGIFLGSWALWGTEADVAPPHPGGPPRMENVQPVQRARSACSVLGAAWPAGAPSGSLFSGSSAGRAVLAVNRYEV